MFFLKYYWPYQNYSLVYFSQQNDTCRFYNCTCYKSMKHQSFDRRHVVYCVQQVFQQLFVHVGYLETLEMYVSDMIQYEQSCMK